MEKICKIVYFDEESLIDYVQIVTGRELEKTTESLNSREVQKGQSAQSNGKVGICQNRIRGSDFLPRLLHIRRTSSRHILETWVNAGIHKCVRRGIGFQVLHLRLDDELRRVRKNPPLH